MHRPLESDMQCSGGPGSRHYYPGLQTAISTNTPHRRCGACPQQEWRRRRQQTQMTAQGAATLVLGGMSPDLIIDQVATHGGATRVGLDLLEQRGAEKALCDAIRETTQATRMLGQALKNEKA
ncbi:hypothetical protein MPDQ_002716 [Monascus purpureus]|uniref:Pyrroline-5-carboxylate reductase dimerisation domain-containing protein n=1 Tax=Monascus purpureus TaxID=5098 RepID=A0A507QNW8_MONPU|nr:hypothetical protein MPDQ_002716 [Monascus purpureus]